MNINSHSIFGILNSLTPLFFAKYMGLSSNDIWLKPQALLLTLYLNISLFILISLIITNLTNPLRITSNQNQLFFLQNWGFQNQNWRFHNKKLRFPQCNGNVTDEKYVIRIQNYCLRCAPYPMVENCVNIKFNAEDYKHSPRISNGRWMELKIIYQFNCRTIIPVIVINVKLTNQIRLIYLKISVLYSPLQLMGGNHPGNALKINKKILTLEFPYFQKMLTCISCRAQDLKVNIGKLCRNRDYNFKWVYSNLRETGILITLHLRLTQPIQHFCKLPILLELY